MEALPITAGILAKNIASSVIDNSNTTDLLRYFQFNEVNEINLNQQIVDFLQKEFNLEDLIREEIEKQVRNSADTFSKRIEVVNESQSVCSEIEPGLPYRYVHDGIESENSYASPSEAQAACVNKLIGFKQFYKE